VNGFGRTVVVAPGRIAVKLGLHYWNYSTPPEPTEIAATLAETARIAEQAGVFSFTVMDHFFQMDQAGSADEPMLEGYTTLSYVAAKTERMVLGVLVTGVMYRHPGLLAKTVTTLDVLSGGRARLGLGASWYEREQLGLGVPVVPVAERFERLEETLQICLQMWSDNNGPFQGRHYQLAETLCVPAPIGRAHPPILIGGGGEKKTLLLAARYADACNLFGASPAEVGHKLAVLRSHCDAEGRDYDRIDKTVLAVRPALADVEGFIAAAGEYAALGVTELLIMPDRHPVEFAEQIAEQVLPRLADVGPTR
jgi:F420-dependent oxidoreductase-like protein